MSKNNIPMRVQRNERLGKINVENIIIIDWCSGTKPIKNYIKHKNCKFISVDFQESVKPDIVADACKPIVIEQADMAFCIEALEHVKEPEAVLDNIYSNLKSGGILYISVPFLFPRHSAYGDYWRWNWEGILLLLEKRGFKLEELVKFKYDWWVGFMLKVRK